MCVKVPASRLRSKVHFDVPRECDRSKRGYFKACRSFHGGRVCLDLLVYLLLLLSTDKRKKSLLSGFWRRWGRRMWATDLTSRTWLAKCVQRFTNVGQVLVEKWKHTQLQPLLVFGRLQTLHWLGQQTKFVVVRRTESRPPTVCSVYKFRWLQAGLSVSHFNILNWLVNVNEILNYKKTYGDNIHRYTFSHLFLGFTNPFTIFTFFFCGLCISHDFQIPSSSARRQCCCLQLTGTTHNRDRWLKGGCSLLSVERKPRADCSNRCVISARTYLEMDVLKVKVCHFILRIMLKIIRVYGQKSATYHFCFFLSAWPDWRGFWAKVTANRLWGHAKGSPICIWTHVSIERCGVLEELISDVT